MSEEENNQLMTEDQKKTQGWWSNKKKRTIFISVVVVLGVLLLVGLGLGLFFGLRNISSSRTTTGSITSGSATTSSIASGSITSSSMTSGSMITSSSVIPFQITRAVGQYNVNTFGGDGGSPLSASLRFPQSIHFIPSLNSLYIFEQNRVRRVTYTGSPIINTVVGTGNPGCNLNPTNALVGTTLGNIGNIGFQDNRILISDSDGNRILSYGTPIDIEVWSGSPSCVAGELNGSRPTATWTLPGPIARDSVGNIYISNSGNLIRKWTAATNIVSTFAGGGASALSPAFQTATNVSLPFLLCRSFQIIGNDLFFLGLGFGSSTICQITDINTPPSQIRSILSTVGASTISAFCFNPSDNFWYLGYTDFTIYRTTDLGLTPTLFAGSPGIEGTTGDNGPAIDARIGTVFDMTLDSNNGLFLLIPSQSVIRRIQL